MSNATNLTNDTYNPGAGNNLFVRNRTTSTTTLVTVSAAGTSTNSSQAPVLSANGRYVAFLSYASNLVAGFVSGNGGLNNLYLHDLQEKATRLVTVNDSGTASGDIKEDGIPYRFSGDGSTLVFDSPSSDLYADDRNGQGDVFATSTAGFSSIRGEVFNDLNANGALDAGEPGLPYWTVFLDLHGTGKLTTDDPSVITDATGHYSIQGLAPGTYTVVIVPQAGYVQTTPTSPLTYTVTITTDGTAITGKNFGEELPLPDLATSNVTFTPATGAPGQAVTVSWTVSNQGTGAAAGSWQDAVYLSPTPTLGAGAVRVATGAHNGGLAAINGQYTGTATVTLPPTQGMYYVIVQADWRNQLSEGPFAASNSSSKVAVSTSTLTVAVPSLTLGTPANGQLTAAGPNAYYQVTAPAGASLLLTLSSAAAGQLELYARRGSLPTPYDFDFAARMPGQANQTLTVPTAQPGVYYILVHGVSGAAAAGAFTLTASEPGLTIQSLGVTAGGNAGQVTIPIRGTNFTASTQASLVSGGTVLTPVAVELVNPSLLYATFNLAGQATGAYSVRVSDGSHSSTLSGAFAVRPAQGPNLQVHLATPAGIRLNHPTAELVVTFQNTGDTDMPAPVFQLSSDLGTVQVLSSGAAAGGAPATGTVQFMGTGADSPGGVLRAGDQGSVTILLTAPSTATVGSAANVTLSTLPTDTTPIDWSQFKSQLQPPSIPSDAWNVVWNNFTASVGSTYGQLQSVLVSDTAYLNQIGVANPTFSQLLAFELLRADDTLPQPTLDASTDVLFPAPGLQLDFSRRFMQSISGRYTVGMLRRGWVSNWDISAAVQSNGDVLIEDAGTPRLFTAQAGGGYLAQPGDHGVLTLVNGAYQLRETDGTVYAFLANGQLNYVQDANGNRITAGYTGAQLTSLTSSDGQALNLAYNGQGLLQTITDPNGKVAVTYSYDASGQHLLSVTTPEGTTQYTYVTGQGAAEENALASVVNPDGTQTHYTYDSQGRLTGSFNGTAASPISQVTLAYVSPGGVAFTDANNHTTTIQFTNLGQPAVVTNALGQATDLSYDANGNLVTALLPDGSTYAYTYDAHGNLLSATDALDQTTNFTYDDNNNLSSYTDAKNHTTRYGYDASNDLLSITYADGSQQRYSYNPLGEATQLLNARGHAVGFSYYPDGQLSGETFADGTSYAFKYDTRGNLTSATDGQNRVTTFTYGGDPNNPNNPDLLTEVQYPDGTFLKFSYYAGGQRKQSVDQAGFTVNYDYDPDGRLLKLTDGGNNLIVQYTYDAAGELTQKDMGNGTRTVYSYDAAGKVLSITNYAPNHTTVNSSDAYTYDTVGNVLTDTNQDGQWVYTYDTDGQLTNAVFTPNATNPDGLMAQNLQYVYDAAGNRISATVNGVTTTYVTNSVNEYTSSTTAGTGTTTSQYDLDGNMISQTGPSNNTTTYTFNDLNQLTAVSGPGLSASYFYDPLGNRVSQTVNGATTNYQIDPLGLGNVVAAFGGTGAYNNSGGLQAHYTYGLGLVSQVSAGGAPAYYDFGLTGNTIGIANAAGSYINRYSYLPFGETTTLTAGLTNTFAYGGQYGVMTDASGLMAMGLRRYNPVTGQFASSDPAGLAGGDLDLRRYAANSPLNYVDPSGLSVISTVTAFGAPWTIYTGSDATAFGQQSGVLTADGGWGNTNAATWGSADGSQAYTIVNPSLSQSSFYDTVWVHEGQHADDYTNPDLFPYLSPPDSIMKSFLERRAYGREVRNRHITDIQRRNAQAALTALQQNPTTSKLLSSGLGSKQVSADIPFLAPRDPNDLLGPAGFGAPGYVSPQGPLPYTIQFENDPKIANAAAQEVTVTEQLDPNLDWTTFQLGNIQFGATTISVPDELQSFSTTVSTTNVDGSPLEVQITAGLNQVTGVVTWTFVSLDPATGQAPLDPVAGFLPVDDSTHRGEAFVRYTVRPKATDSTGTPVGAQASVVFDTNAPLSTNSVSNTIDAGPPTSSVKAVPASSASTFPLSWSGQDVPGGSGIATYTVFVSDDGALYVPLVQNTTTTSTVFTGQPGHSYSFYSLATDNVGNQQAVPSAPQATTAVALPALPLLHALSLSSGGTTYQLASDGTLSQLTSSGTTRLDTGVDAIGLSGGNLLDLEDNGLLYLHSSAGWKLLDVGVISFQADASGNVYLLEGNGNLRQYSSTTGTLGILPLGSSVQSIGVTPSGTLYFLDEVGNLRQDTGGTVSLVKSSVQSFQLDNSGNLYQLLATGNLIENAGATPLASNVLMFWVTGAGVVTDLQRDGTLQQAGATVATGVSSFRVAADGTLFYLTAGNSLMKQGSSTPIDTGVSTFTLSGDGSLYELQGGNLLQRNGTVVRQLDSGVTALAVGDNGVLYDLESGSALYQHSVAGWMFLDSGVTSVLAPLGGGIVDLESGGILWQHTTAGWTKLDSAVTALSQAQDGFTTDVVDGTGPRTLTGIVTSLPNSTGTLLYEQLQGGSLWQYSTQSSAWTTLDSGVQSIALTASNLLLDLESNGALYGNTGSGWETLAHGVLSYSIFGNQVSIVTATGPQLFTTTSSGTGYELLNDGNLYQLSTAGTSVLDTGVDSFAVSGGNVLDLEDNGQLWQHGSSGWQLIDLGVATFQADSKDDIAILEDNGTLRTWNSSSGLSLSPLGTGVQSVAMTPGGTIYFLSGGVLQQDAGGTLSQVATNVTSFQLSSSGILYFLSGTTLNQDVGGTISTLLTGVGSFQLDGSGNRYELLSNNNLIENEATTTPLATNVTSFQVSRNGVVSDLQNVTGSPATGTLQQAGVTVASGVSSFAVAQDGSLYYLSSSGGLFQRFGTTVLNLDSGVHSFAVADNGGLYDLESSGALYQHSSDGWTFLDSGLSAVLSPLGGGFLDLEKSGVLWDHTSAGWTKLDSGVTALALAADGFTANVTDGSGTHALTGIETALSDSSHTVLDELLSDSSLWQYHSGSWTRLDSAVQSIAIATDNTLVDLETNGNLYSNSNAHWTLLDTAVSSFTLTGNTVTAKDSSGTRTFTV
jgi:RHS repeat-associated protein